MLTSFLLKKNKKILERIFQRHIVSGIPIQINRAVVLSKVTRYEVEKACNPELTKSELENLIKSRGSNYESLLDHHQRHKDYEKYVLDSFEEMGISTKLLTRLDYTDSWIESSDIVFPVGGDGTFLLAASKVRDRSKPVIGFNSDPHHSEGFLCLDRKYSYSVKDVLQRLKEYDEIYSSSLVSPRSFSSLVSAQPLNLSSYRKASLLVLLMKYTINSSSVSFTKAQKFETLKSIGVTHPHWCSKKEMSSLAASQLPNVSSSLSLPTLALNEVFVGERLSAQVSYFEMKLPPSQETFKVKSSGLCVSTGTGSTSWHLSMNRVTDHRVAHILQCAGLSPSPSQCQTIADSYNDSLLFDPEQMEMCYTIRDLICAGVWPSPPGLPPRGFARTLWIRSHCHDARLVIDGGAALVFNDGSEALFELYPEDALRTVIL